MAGHPVDERHGWLWSAHACGQPPDCPQAGPKCPFDHSLGFSVFILFIPLNICNFICSAIKILSNFYKLTKRLSPTTTAFSSPFVGPDEMLIHNFSAVIVWANYNRLLFPLFPAGVSIKGQTFIATFTLQRTHLCTEYRNSRDGA